MSGQCPPTTKRGSKKLKPIIATHALEHERCDFTFRGQVYTYNVPVLAEKELDEIDVKCYRERTAFDDEEILKARGMQSAMGFDPGGSATLVVGEETLNISPYNRDYERNVYSLPPQPRAVANAVVGY